MNADSPLQLSNPNTREEPATRALLLTQNSLQARRLEGLLRNLNIQSRKLSCASGAAAVLRREDLRGHPINFLLVDGQWGGICGMNLCAALCMPLRQRPVVLLTAPLAACLNRATLTRSGISAVIEEDTPLEDVGKLLRGLLQKFHVAQDAVEHAQITAL